MAGGAGLSDGGNTGRFKQLALPYLDELYTLARYLMRNADDADDAVQECYLRAFRHFDTFRGGPIKPWLMAILRNVCRAGYAGNARLVYGLDDRQDGETAEPIWREDNETPEQIVVRSHEFANIAPADRRAAGGVPRSDRAARNQRPVLSRYSDCHRGADRHGNVASGARENNSPRGLGRSGREYEFMTCEEAGILLHALIDGELDAGNAREVEAHVAACPSCAAQLRGVQALRTAMIPAQLRYTAPAYLRTGIEGKLPAPAAAAASRRAAIKGFALGAAISALAASGLFLMIARRDGNERILDEVVSAHLRSLQGEHLIDVASSDQHTVKPWFNGRLDASPPVMDLTAQGFTLLGARVDYVDAKPVAAIVYRRRVHIINLFCEPASNSAARAASVQSLHGFNVRQWSEKGLNLWAVSDLNSDELGDFGEKFEAALLRQ